MLEVKALSKAYGNTLVVDNLSFTLEKNKIYGLLGQNGAGKSTTMNMLTGCLAATAGEIKIDGFDIVEESKQAKKLIGYLPELPPLYPELTPREYLNFVGTAKGLKKEALKDQVQKAMEATGLNEVTNKLIRQLSKGFKQRVGIAQALLGQPEYIILDEPTVGLDPIQIIEIRELIRSLAKEHTVLLSSHILSEIASLCDYIIIISKGKLVGFDTSENLEKAAMPTTTILIRTKATAEKLNLMFKDYAEEYPYKYQEDKEYNEISFTIDADKEEAFMEICNRLFYENQETIYDLTRKKASLEDVFIELTEEKENAGNL